jgi:uncharacterized membrane protein YgaE (UPF0421/DUF939 family)
MKLSPGSRFSAWVKEKDLGKQAISALKTGIAAVICVWLGNLLHLEHAYWAAVSAIVVMANDATITFSACRDRIIGTGIGAFLAWGAAYLWHGHYLVYGLAVALCIFLCSLLTFEKAGRLAAVTLSIVVLVDMASGPAWAAFSRFLEVALGIVVALIVTLVVFPTHAEKREVQATEGSAGS